MTGSASSGADCRLVADGYGDTNDAGASLIKQAFTPCEPSKMFIAITEEEHMLVSFFRRSRDRHTELQLSLRRIEDRLDLIFHMEKRIMGATEDAVAKLQGIADESDTILAGVQAIEAAKGTGDQAAIDAAVNAAVATISTAADNTKAHVDAALAAVQSGLPAAPPAPAPAG